MTDHAELRRLAKRADALHGTPSLEHVFAITKFREAVEPKAILAMLDEIDRLKAENEALRGALQAVVDDPTWRSNDNTLWPKIIKALGKGATQ
ncbi:ead/Ea22-like family protein [Pseudomonas aeruginosa]|uniref:ead/Ea22-like family protein n=1 Tax=Pseudomonas aeruginosa TaxID=287 RepID=UPI000DEEC27E|nr:ead/Ea22-like family protein [Pseudomonas aeruginosa]RCM35117.1 hypothetical protein PA171_04281 [Pseudomonas aeruginosa]